jgi:hypothetical protein
MAGGKFDMQGAQGAIVVERFDALAGRKKS